MTDYDKSEPGRVSGDPTREQKTFTMDDLNKDTLITEPVPEDCKKRLFR